MRLLVTGFHGFVGSHYPRGDEVVGLYEAGDPRIDLTDFTAIKNKISQIKPDAILHLAAQSHVPRSCENPRETFEVNFFGTFNLLSALRENIFSGRMIYVGSSEEYGQVDESELPIRESSPLKPRSPYAVSKVAAEALCYEFSQTSGFEVIMTRPFNHIGPGQNESFVISNFAKQIIEIKKGLRKPELLVGDLEVTRDFTDVRDVVRAYQVLLKKGRNGEVYNICSGRENKISQLLYKILELAGVKAEIREDPQRLRKGEQRRVVGSHKKLQADTGWNPAIPIEQTLKDVLNYWKEKVS